MVYPTIYSVDENGNPFTGEEVKFPEMKISLDLNYDKLKRDEIYEIDWDNVKMPLNGEQRHQYYNVHKFGPIVANVLAKFVRFKFRVATKQEGKDVDPEDTRIVFDAINVIENKTNMIYLPTDVVEDLFEKKAIRPVKDISDKAKALLMGLSRDK